MSERRPTWYYFVQGRRFGPVRGSELRRLVQAGELNAEDLVWKEGMSEWVTVRKVKGLLPDSSTGSPPLPRKADVRKNGPPEIAGVSVDPHNAARPEDMVKSVGRETGKPPARLPDKPLPPTGESSAAADSIVLHSRSRGWPIRKLLFTLIGCIGIPLLLLGATLAAIGIYSYLDTRRLVEERRQKDEQAVRDFKEAQQLWILGQADKALVIYKQLLTGAFPNELSSERATIYQRVIEDEVKQGNTETATDLITQARKVEAVELVFTDPVAQELLGKCEEQLAEEKRLEEEAQREAERVAARERRVREKREAEEKRKAEEAVLAAPFEKMTARTLATHIAENLMPGQGAAPELYWEDIYTDVLSNQFFVAKEKIVNVGLTRMVKDECGIALKVLIKKLQPSRN